MSRSVDSLTTDDILTAAQDHLVTFKVAWDALGDPSEERDEARRKVIEAIRKGRRAK